MKIKTQPNWLAKLAALPIPGQAGIFIIKLEGDKFKIKKKKQKSFEALESNSEKERKSSRGNDHFTHAPGREMIPLENNH